MEIFRGDSRRDTSSSFQGAHCRTMREVVGGFQGSRSKSASALSLEFL